MLEQQQEKLVNAIRELYARSVKSGSWTGAPLQNTPKGHPLTHYILERLGFLKLSPHDAVEVFEENTELLRQRMMVKQEENPYPTPMTIQTEFSPTSSPRYDFFSTSGSFADAYGPPTPFRNTPLSQSPAPQASMPFPDALCINASMSMEMTACQTWSSTGNAFEDATGYPYSFSPPELAEVAKHRSSISNCSMPQLCEDDFCNISTPARG